MGPGSRVTRPRCSSMAMLRDKRFILGMLITEAGVAVFWGASLCSARHEKLLVASASHFSGLAFSALVDISPDEKTLPRIFYTFINWSYTNRQGMTFGILFGALVMTLLALIERRRF